MGTPVPSKSRNPNGRDRALNPAQRATLHALFLSGQSREELAVGFGVSYNTVRNVLREFENEKTPGTDIPRGLDESLSPGGPRNTLGEDTSGVATPSESAISAPKAEGDAIHD